MAHVLSGLRGVIHGKTIELEQDPSLPEGMVVSVTLLPVARPGPRLPPGEGIRRSAGGWAEDAEELDRYLEEIRQERKICRPDLEP